MKITQTCPKCKGVGTIAQVRNKGIKNPGAKLNEQQVRDIRHLSKGMTPRELAIEFSVSGGAIADVLSYRTWAHTRDLD